ncbi:MAG: hypothetical protein LBD11_03025 [Candidatus Peribacteria bacterium]|jgi:hypothetical protein|nr:hypothetical protein [Candidatus Peribacteria bacterium]
MIVILGHALVTEGFPAFRSVFSLFSYFWLGFLAFIVFVLGLLYSVEKKYSYELFLAGGVVIVTLIVNAISSLALGFFISLLLLSGYYLLTLRVKRWKVPQKEHSLLSVRRILAGERIKQKHTFPKRKINLHDWITSSP